jgi:hypothetical protein
LRVHLGHVIDPQYLCKPFDYPTWQIIVALQIGGSSTRGMSQIWLEVRQEWRKKKNSDLFWPLSGKFCLNMATSRYFFKRKKPYVSLCTEMSPKKQFTAKYADLTYLMNLCFKLIVPEDGNGSKGR